MTTITQIIPEFSGLPPSIADPTNFDARASTTLEEMVDFPPATNTWSGQVNTVAGEVNAAAAAAELSATTAEEAAAAVLSQGTTADAWASGTTYALYAVAIGSDGRAYRSLQAGNLNHNPVTDTGTWWIALNPDPNFAAVLIFGSGIYPDWAMQAQGPVGTYPPTDPYKPACTVWSRGVERYRATYTWGTTGGSLNAPETIVLERSVDSGSNYSAVTTNNKATMTYDSTGAVLAIAWSAAA